MKKKSDQGRSPKIWNRGPWDCRFGVCCWNTTRRTEAIQEQKDRELNLGNRLHVWWESQRGQAEDIKAAHRWATAGNSSCHQMSNSSCHPEAGGTEEGNPAGQWPWWGRAFHGSWSHSGPFWGKLTPWRRNGHSIDPAKTEKVEKNTMAFPFHSAGSNQCLLLVKAR